MGADLDVSRRELRVHEMWCGSDDAGEPVWHVLATDKTSTLCGVDKRQEWPPGSEPTDRHCFPCMRAFQRTMQTS
ncbi:hypothetical protein E4U91_04420 [Streptomyces lasalocidi]|uniref:Uncharacterized protein n=1 Tax=Streptomyces lasalocidi TaxID=324833 RepID=A0A4U5WCE0_STRLS|nr:hypothetical protein E4U91_04420 [Streptomyces lasalocidi]